MWKSINMRSMGDFWDMDMKDKMTRNIVDRSCGVLIDINIEYFGTDDLLKYITDRASNLKRLRLVSCNSISDEGLSEGARNLPLLEELNLSDCSFSKEALEAIGQCCPLLKTLKFNRQGFRRAYREYNDEALAIAENMPELRHLELFGNKMTDDGLQAILDGCPHLESLDLRQCFSVKLAGDLGKRCDEVIKYFRSPHDTTDDYEFFAQVYEQCGISDDAEVEYGPTSPSFPYDPDVDESLFENSRSINYFSNGTSVDDLVGWTPPYFPYYPDAEGRWSPPSFPGDYEGE